MPDVVSIPALSYQVERDDRGLVTLGAGEVFVVPKGVEHRPVAASVAYALMLERPETAQYGN